MTHEGSRRQFLKRVGLLAAAGPATRLYAIARPLLSNALLSAPMDGAHFAVHPTVTGIQLGYASITWGGNERQAIDDISSLGFRGIQMRANAATDFQPGELRDLLSQHNLTFVALSSGEVDIDPSLEKEQIAKHVANAKFVKDVGGLYLQVLDKLVNQRPRIVTPAECKRLAQLLNAIGEQTTDLGIPLGYHNHMNTLSERPENLERILDASDPRYVHLELDIAHYLGGGGDPAKAILQYHDRLLFLHLKDMLDEPMGTEKNQKYPIKWVELGQGRVDIPAVFAALHKTNFHGWAIVELDRVPDKSKTPRESAMISKTYLADKIGLTV